MESYLIAMFESRVQRASSLRDHLLLLQGAHKTQQPSAVVVDIYVIIHTQVCGNVVVDLVKVWKLLMETVLEL